MRLIDVLVARALASDERSARGLILRGDVLVNDRPVTSPAFEVADAAAVRLRAGRQANHLRGADKLAPAVERTGFVAADRVCLDLGVSSGGFTSVLLKQGARRVYAVDVAYGVTALSIRDDPRVVLLERTNARLLTRELIPEPIERLVGDLSFISLAAVLPAVAPLLHPQAEALLLIKPQFELAARGLGQLAPRGVVTDGAALRDSLEHLYNTWVGSGLQPRALLPSAVRGAKGNQEFFVYLANYDALCSAERYAALVESALREAGV